VAKYHVSVPMIDIRAIGAGGGSIAVVRDGLLSVGPESAGAFPGPACYGRGGTRPTVTDANLVLGIIDPEAFLGGRMPLDRDAAFAAIEAEVAQPLGMDVLDAAAGIRRIVDSQMADTLRELTLGRGHDPRDFVLYAYGGAGPMHCAGYGADLGVARIVVPATSMAQSAYGAVASDIHHSAERSLIVRGGGGPLPGWHGIDPKVLQDAFEDLERRCREALRGAGVAAEDTALSRSVDMRYRRQTHQLIIPVPLGVLDEAGVQRLVEAFEQAYEGAYGRGSGFREAGIELITFRVDAIGHTPKPRLAEAAGDGSRSRRSRPVYDRRRRARGAPGVAAAVVDWDGLVTGEALSGPAIVEHPTTTVYVDRGQSVEVDRHRNLIIEGRVE
jgi:N-methylhydantoinase A